MKKNKTPIAYKLRIFAVVAVLLFAAAIIGKAQADQFDQQIQAIEQQNANKQQQQTQLGDQADGLNATINKLQIEIDSLQGQINKYKDEINGLQKQIDEQEAELVRQKKVLGENIQQIYFEGQISTLEMLASSQDLSQFVDKQEYRDSLNSQIQDILGKITQLKQQLNAKKDKLETILANKKSAQEELSQKQSRSRYLLSLNQQQRAAIDQQIKANYTKISELRAQQAIENAKHFSGSNLVTGGACSPRPINTYPDGLCAAPQDSILNEWGWNRECVSYVGWKVYSTTGYSPANFGNANQWANSARARGIPVDKHPRAGDVAVAYWGYYGHVMYVESVNGDGTINVSQYNWDYNGTYSQMYNFSPAGLDFIHFR